MRELRECTKQELLVLVAIISLARENLPYELLHYTRAFGEITRRYFKGAPTPQKAHSDHNPSGRSITQSRTVRARKG